MLTELQNARKKSNYSCQTMANKLGICKTYYWQLEQGKRRLLYSLAIDIAEILKCTTDDLFYDYFMDKLDLKGVESYVNDTKENKKRQSNYNL